MTQPTNKLFAFYRLPHADHYVEIMQDSNEPHLLHSLDELDRSRGFVVVPFQVTSQTPIVLIEPDAVNQVANEAGTQDLLPTILKRQTNREDYHQDFLRFHQELKEGRLSKIVLSRTETILTADALSQAVSLFHRACRLYPRMFVALVSMPNGEMWLTATPEVLLDGSGNHYHTMALAGTMRLQGEELSGEGEHVRWAPKDIEEQRYVASYIADRLKTLGIDYREEGPRTVRAAHLVHLRSDFHFSLPPTVALSRLLSTLHPTPAVCGLPKQQALDFILQHEHSQRLYYSGFMGPLNAPESHLYVTLRCMQISGNRQTLYAGGGLLRESNEEQEWQETEAKLDTMRHILYNNV